MGAVLGAIGRAVFGGASLIDIIKIGIKIAMLFVMLALTQQFIQLLLSHIPVTNLSGCIGYYVRAWGFVDGIQLMLSIVIYGYVVKLTMFFMSRIFD